MVTAGYLPRLDRSVAAWRYDHRCAYIDMQLRAAFTAHDGLEVGELRFSEREAAGWWGMSYKTVRGLLDFLESEELVAYPEGRPRRLYRLRLLDYWGAQRADEKGASNGASGGAWQGAWQGASEGACNPQSNNGLGGERAQAGAQAGAHERAQAGAQAGAHPRKEGKNSKLEVTTNDLNAGAGANGDGASSDPSGRVVQRLVGVLVAEGLFGAGVSGALYDEQASVIRRLVAQHGEEATEQAIRGVRKLYPFSRGSTPYDAAGVEQRFAKARAAYLAPPEAPEKAAAGTHGAGGGEGYSLEAAERERGKKQEQEAARTARHEARVGEWEQRVRPMLEAEPAETRRALVREERQKLQQTFAWFDGLPKERRDAMIRRAVLQRYGAEHGDPIPPI